MEIIAGGGGNSLRVWDASSGRLIKELSGHTKTISCVSFSPCGALLASSGFSDRSIIIWNCLSWIEDRRLIGTSGVSSVYFSRFGDKIVSTSMDLTIRVWSLITNLEEHTFSVCAVPLLSAIFDASSGSIMALNHRSVNIYDSSTGEQKTILSSHRDSVRSVDCTADGKMVASGSMDSGVIIWDTASGGVLHRLHKHSEAVSQVRFNADASKIVSSSWDKTARIWDVSTGECLLTLHGHQKVLHSCCFNSEGSRVITASDDHTMKVWDSITGEELRSISTPIFAVESVAYQPYETGSYL